MLNIFNNTNYKQYKTGFVLDKENNEVMFKYNKQNRTDIEDIDLLVNVGTNSSKFIIMTTSSIEFSTENKLKLDGKFYHIESIYTEDNENENGFYRTNLIKKKYLVVKR